MCLKLDQPGTAAAEYAEILAAVEVGQLEMTPDVRSKVAAKLAMARAAAEDSAAGRTLNTVPMSSPSSLYPSPSGFSRQEANTQSPVRTNGAEREGEEAAAAVATEAEPALAQASRAPEPPPAPVAPAEGVDAREGNGTVQEGGPARVETEEPFALQGEELAAAVVEKETALSAPPPEPESELPAEAETEAVPEPAAAEEDALPIPVVAAPAEPPAVVKVKTEPHAPSAPARPSDAVHKRTMSAASALASAAVSAGKAAASSPTSSARAGHKRAEDPAPIEIRGGDVGGYGYGTRLGRESTHSLGHSSASFTGTSIAWLPCLLPAPGCCAAAAGCQMVGGG